jgi:hypothetical protein
MKSFILGLSLALVFTSPLHAQTPSNAPAENSAPVATQAPDDMTRKITDLVHAGKYLEAQQLTTGLLVAYPEDQRLIKAKAVLDKLLASGASTNAAPETGQPVQAAAKAGGEELTGMDKVDYNALIELAREAQQTTDLAEQNKLLQQFMGQSDLFLQRHPNQMLLWQLRAASAISLNQPMAGYEAGQKLINAGGANSDDATVQRLLGQLKNKGWLEKQGAQTLQQNVDRERAQQEEAADHVRFTFPVVHAKVGFGSNGYGYGHMFIGKDIAVYEGNDETIRLAPTEIREVRVACNVNSCGMYFVPKSGRRFFFLPVTEEAVANRTDKGKIYLKPSVLGNAVVSRWNFISVNDKTLGPAPAGTSTKNPEPALPLSHSPASASKSSPEPTAQGLKSSIGTNNSAPQPVVPALPESASSNNSPRAEMTAGSVSGTVTLHVYRLHHFNGGRIKPSLNIDGKKVAQVENGQGIRMLLAPGKHTLTLSEKMAKADQPINDLDMEAGKEYWVRLDLVTGFLNHVKLYLEPADKAMAESKKLDEIMLGDLSKN